MGQWGPVFGVFAGSGGKGLCAMGESAGLRWEEAGHPPVETTCLRVKPRHGETSHGGLLESLDAAGSRNPVHLTLIP